METRFLLRASQRITRPSISHLQSRVASSSSPSKPPPEQAIPVGDYYNSILSSPSLYASSAPLDSIKREPKVPKLESKPEANPTKSFTTKSSTSTVAPAILFSPRTVTKWERASDLRSKSTLIAGVWVPPKPSEPDNCCMSGCINCVWDLYGDELEQWATARKEADIALAGEGKKEESGWGLGKEIKSEELLEGIDVGIREFMRVEKMLREKHGKDGS